MNRSIARTLIEEELRRLRKLSYRELLKLVDTASTDNVQASDGNRYQIERQAFWDDKRGHNIRVVVSVDDGGLRAFIPMTGSFIISPDGCFVGEHT
jgi:hypothetical protein